MMIIGCDFHPSWEQVAWLDTETGEVGEQKLVHARGEAQEFLPEAERSHRGGAGGDGKLSVAGGSGARMRARGVDRGCSADPGQLRAQAEDGPARRRPRAQAAGGGAVSALVDALAGATRSAAAADPPAQAGADPQPGEERVAALGHEPGDAEAEPAVE